MKKINFLILTALLLLGVQSAIADCYVAHNASLSSQSWKEKSEKMAESEGGYFSYTYHCIPPSTSVVFKITNGTWDWLRYTVASDATTRGNTALTQNDDSKEVSFTTISSISDVTINYQESIGIWVTCTAATMNTVIVYVSYDGVNHLYATGTRDKECALTGDWGGIEPSSTISLAGKSWKKFSLQVPRDSQLKIIPNNGGTGNNNQTEDINVCTISRDMTFYYVVTSNGEGSKWSAQRYYSHSICGDFNAWNANDVFINDNVSINISDASTDYLYKVTDGSTWYGLYPGSGTITSSNTSLTLYSDDSNNAKFTPSIAGQYIFNWNSTTHELSVTYPEQPRTGLTAGNYGTICLSKAVPASSISGATFYNIYGKNAESNPSELWLVEETGDLVAGQPYIFKATGTAITVTYTGESASAGYNNGLYGTLSAKTTSDMNTLVGTEGKDIYLLSGNKVVKAGTDCTLSAGRAYIDMAQVPCPASGPSPSAIRFDLDENNTTSINAIEASEKAVKIFENGQMYILRSGVKYDATGRVVK